MSESQQPAAEFGPELAIPISDLVEDIGPFDTELLTQIAVFDMDVTSKQGDVDMGQLLPWAMDQAFLFPHRTAQALRSEDLGKLSHDALELAQKAAKSHMAYRVSGNPKLPWMARITKPAYDTIIEDRVFRERRDHYTSNPGDSWPYMRMQSRLFVCLAWMAQGKEMEKRRLNPAIQRRIAAELMRLEDDANGI